MLQQTVDEHQFHCFVFFLLFPISTRAGFRPLHLCRLTLLALYAFESTQFFSAKLFESLPEEDDKEDNV